MSGFDKPCILTNSISGVVANKQQCAAIPYTPEEYAAEARRAVDAGASMIHIHARTPDGNPSFEIEDYRNITDAIKAEIPDVIINFSTGAVGISVEKRLEYLEAIRPDVAALNMGSMNYAKYSKRRKEFVFGFVFENSFETIIQFLRAMNEYGIRPEHECFEVGHLASLEPLIDMGILETPLQISLVHGVLGGTPARVANLRHMASQVPQPDGWGGDGVNNWGLVGVSREQWDLLPVAVEEGGNVRVGLEDNFYLPSGEMAGSNGDLCAEAARQIEAGGRKVASIAEARELLGVPRNG
ncbi:MAG: 3-keto-5-aminohexanoate cleavage protein [Solirubrobacterales bacterium]